MKDQIVEKLRRELERPITAEPLVVYLLVEIRKLLEHRRIQYDTLRLLDFRPIQCDTLRLCCNWAVHVKLSRDAARRIVKHVDALYPRLVNDELTDGDKESLRAFFLMSKFRSELEDFLARDGLRGFQNDEWNGFLACFLNVIEDCPLICKASGLANVDKVVLIREVGNARVPSQDAPAIVWALYHQNQHVLTLDENLEKSNGPSPEGVRG